MKYVVKSDCGKKREKNEDYVLVKTIDENVSIYIVADGLGGYASGEVASKLAVEIISQYFENKYSNNKKCDAKEVLKQAIILSNNEIYALEKTNEKYKGMGTTIVLLCAFYGKFYYASIGDSRMYNISEDFSKIKQITEDDTYVNTLLKTNVINEVEAENHPQKHMLTRAIGIFNKIDVEVKQIEEKIAGYLMLCTDGVSNMLDESEILNACKRNKFEVLAEKIVARANDKGGNDNITVIVIKL